MSRLSDKDVELRATMLANARRWGMSNQALLVLAEELLSEVRASREAAAQRPGRACMTCINKLTPSSSEPCRSCFSIRGLPQWMPADKLSELEPGGPA